MKLSRPWPQVLTWPNTLKIGKHNAFRYIVALFVIGILCQNLLLLRNNRVLQRRLELEIDREFKLGEVLPGFSGVGLDGKYVKVDFKDPEKKYLLITFSPGCPACHSNLANWQALSKNLNPARWRVIWISRDPIEHTSEFCLLKNIPTGQVLSEVSLRNYNALGLRTVPWTIITNSEGKIEKAWMGKFDDNRWMEVFKHVGWSP